MKILFDNKILDATISALYDSTTYPAENLKSVFLHQKFQSTENNDTLTVTFDDNVSVDSFFWGFTNMTAMEVRFYDDTDTLLERIYFSGGDVAHYYGYPTENYYGYDDYYYGYFDRIGNKIYDPVSWYLSETLSVKKIEIELEADSSVYLGGIGVGLAESFNLPSNEWTDDFDDKSIVSESDKGQVLQEYVKPYRVYDFNFPVNTRDEVLAIEKKYGYYGIGTHL